MRPPDEAERRRLHALFAELCAIESPFEREDAIVARVTDELQGLGLEVESDDFGNLLARVPPPVEGARTIVLCAHLDTVLNSGPIEPVEV
ncbi:MAG TPA: hypothetical protein VIL49_05835, partial [Capillimicrobium sp.]